MSGDQTHLLELQDRLLGKHFERNIEDSMASAKLVDSALAKEFSKLSVHERSKTYEELHGVNDCVEETPIFVQNSLRQLEAAIARIAVKSAYEMAVRQNENYVMGVKFRLMFLRADGFHAEKAAIRLVGYFEGKLRYFGESLLTKRIQFSDLDEDDQACVKGGHLQLFPSRDRSGRAIFTDLNILHDQSYRTAANRLKAHIYMWLILAEDEENQKRGLVLILMQMGSTDMGSASPTLTREHPRVQNWLPIRVCALHCCSDDIFTGFLFRAAVVGAPSDSRARFRFHHGTYTEMLYSLLGYGIPVDVFPSIDGLAIKKTNLNRWIAKYVARDIELANNGGDFAGIDLPARNDVLAGAGKPTQQHFGNVNLRVQVENCLEEYLTAPGLRDKMDVVYKVYSMVKAGSGRFLQKGDDGWWRELPKADAVEKVKLTFHREKRRKNNLHHNGLAHAKPDNGGDNPVLFLQQAKRPKFHDSCCCGS